MTIAADARLEYRLRSEAKRKIEKAAALVHESASDFARTAAEQRAEQVLAEHSHLVTIVPSEFFDDLLAALDEPPTANSALRTAARRAHREVEQR
jgi:uncharacterized protein (DUF1778 family)